MNIAINLQSHPVPAGAEKKRIEYYTNARRMDFGKFLLDYIKNNPTGASRTINQTKES